MEPITKAANATKKVEVAPDMEEIALLGALVVVLVSLEAVSEAETVTTTPLDDVTIVEVAKLVLHNNICEKLR